MKETVIINIYGGPGVGKSTLAARVFAELREQGLEAELVTEYAKELVWFGRQAEMADQLSIFAQQHRRILRVWGKVEYIVTDSPILNSLLYQPKGYPESFSKMVREFDARFPRQLNFLLERKHPYERSGRVHTEREAISLDQELPRLLESNLISYKTIGADTPPVQYIMAELQIG